MTGETLRRLNKLTLKRLSNTSQIVLKNFPGKAFFHLEKYNEAIEDFETAIILSKALFCLKKLEKAIENFKLAAELWL